MMKPTDTQAQRRRLVVDGVEIGPFGGKNGIAGCGIDRDAAPEPGTIAFCRYDVA